MKIKIDKDGFLRIQEKGEYNRKPCPFKDGRMCNVNCWFFELRRQSSWWELDLCVRKYTFDWNDCVDEREANNESKG